jgi:hypothetical protein
MRETLKQGDSEQQQRKAMLERKPGMRKGSTEQFQKTDNDAESVSGAQITHPLWGSGLPGCSGDPGG